MLRPVLLEKGDLSQVSYLHMRYLRVVKERCKHRLMGGTRPEADLAETWCGSPACPRAIGLAGSRSWPLDDREFGRAAALTHYL